MTALPGLAAVIALIFAWPLINVTNHQLQIAELGQITDRYNAAITNLGFPSIDVRLGGIYALQRIMQDSSLDQPTVVAVLCAFVRDHASAANARSAHRRPTSSFTSSDLTQPPTDIRAALAVVSTRNTAHDSSTTVVDFAGANLSGSSFSSGPGAADLSGAILTGANLSGAILPGVDLSGARLVDADLSGAWFSNVNLSDADLTHANLTNVYQLSSADLSGADLTDVNLTGANFTNTDLSGVDLSGMDLAGENLTGANLSGADLTGADLTHADLTGAKLTGAKLTGAKGISTGGGSP